MDDCGRDDYAADYNDDDGVANNVPWGGCEFEATEKNVVNREASNPGEVKSKGESAGTRVGALTAHH